MAVAIAAIVTVIVRLTVFGDDCNLLVVWMTFIVAFVVVYILMRVFCRYLK